MSKRRELLRCKCVSRQGSNELESLGWPRYCWTAGTRRPGCLIQRPRARRAVFGTLPPARNHGEGERVWTVYDVGGHHGPPGRL